MKPKKIIVIILIVIVIIFGLQNIGTGKINILFWNLEMPRVFLIFIVFIIGFISGVFFKVFK